jgi:glucose-6-phosphate 1-dehydrogenase
MIGRLVILGASGDLTSRYLMPALAQLHQAGRLPEGFEVVGIARKPWLLEDYRRHVAGWLREHAGDVGGSSREALISMLSYRVADAAHADEVVGALGSKQEPFIAYLALPPAAFAPAVESLASLHPPEGSRIVVEKPFGEDIASARALNGLLHRCFPERAVFRIDHFLHKQTVQNVLGLRFANRVFEPLWNAEHVSRVEIVWDESLALEGRASYYDATGALKDMIQNHLLQLLCLVAMEPPGTFGERDFRNRKVDVLRAVATPSLEAIARGSLRGRYVAGKIGDRSLRSYVDEPGVEAGRGTETFAQVTLSVQNGRWAGVPFVLRSGKALAEDRRHIELCFKPVPHLAFGQDSAPRPNVLRMQLDPDRVGLDVSINGPGDPFDLEDVELAVELAPQEIPAYGRLLLDVLQGDPVLSIRDDEAEECWRIVDPIAGAWASGGVPLLDYRAGASGPVPDGL